MRSLLPSTPSRSRRLASLLAVGFALALMIPASASAAAFTAHLSAPNHTPIMNKKWPITVTATRGSTKLSGTVSYQFVSYGTVEANKPGGSFTKGVFHDTLVFPAEAVGHPLTLRVVVKTKYGTVDINWAVTTKS